MKQKVLKNAWLRVCMIAAVMTTAFVGTSRAEDITASPTSITATSGALDDFVTYSSTESSVSNNTINLSQGSATFTVALTENAISWGSKIKSVKFATNRLSGYYKVNGGSEQSVSISGGICTVSGLVDCNSIEFYFKQYTSTISSIEVTYTAPTLPYTLNVTANEGEWGTIESVVGNIITAKPAVGYQFANPAYSVEGTATVSQDGNKFYVTDAANGSTVNVTINFDRSSVSPEYIVDFESALNTYESWEFVGVSQSNLNRHAGENCGQTHNGSTITTATKIANPGTLTFYARGGETTAATWTVNVSSDGSNWGDALVTKTITGYTYEKVEVSLGNYSDVYVRISCSANSGNYAAIDDIDLTTLASLINVTVTSVGYATFCCEKAVDFTDSGIEAYTATLKGLSLTLNPITEVPANTGVILVAEGGKTAQVPVIESATTAEGNCLTGVNVETTLNEDDLILNVKDGKPGFYRAATHTTLKAHRAYISRDYFTEGVKDFIFDGDSATAIMAVEGAVEDGAIYNLAGQRLQKMQKGINIVNGKKILF